MLTVGDMAAPCQSPHSQLSGAVAQWGSATADHTEPWLSPCCCQAWKAAMRDQTPGTAAPSLPLADAPRLGQDGCGGGPGCHQGY